MGTCISDPRLVQQTSETQPSQLLPRTSIISPWKIIVYWYFDPSAPCSLFPYPSSWSLIPIACHSCSLAPLFPRSRFSVPYSLFPVPCFCSPFPPPCRLTHRGRWLHPALRCASFSYFLSGFKRSFISGEGSTARIRTSSVEQRPPAQRTQSAPTAPAVRRFMIGFSPIPFPANRRPNRSFSRFCAHSRNSSGIYVSFSRKGSPQPSL